MTMQDAPVASGGGTDVRTITRWSTTMLLTGALLSAGWSPAPTTTVRDPLGGTRGPATAVVDAADAVPTTVASVVDGLPAATEGPLAEALADVGLVGSASVAIPTSTAVAFTLPEGIGAVYVRADGPGGATPWTRLDLVDPLDGPDGVAAPARRVTDLAWLRAADTLQVAAPAGTDLGGVRVHLTDTLGLRAAGPGGVAAVLAALEDPVGEVTDLVEGIVPPGPSPKPSPKPSPSAKPTPKPSASPAPRQASSARPAVVRRSEWGARSATSRHSTARPRAVVVHHTATRNDYRKAESPAIVRAIQHHHQRTLGWSDVGYNLLIDRYGQLFEGRAGGIEAGVVGAHARGYNTGTVGVGLIGNYEEANATRSLLDRLADVTAWQARVHGIDLREGARTTVNGRRIATFLGHRDVGQTACPGRNVVRKMAEVRGLALRARR